MPLTPEQRAVKDASLKAQDAMRKLDHASLSELQHIYDDAAKDIKNFLLTAAGAAGVVAVSGLAYVMLQVRSRLDNVTAARDAVLEKGIAEAAAIGVRPFETRVDPVQAATIRQEAAQYVRDFVGSDKLTLSDRIWRLDRHAQEIVGQAVQNAVIRGQGAMQAAQEFLAKGIALPADLALARDAASAGRIGETVSESLLTGRGAPLDNALRVMRTEINRTHTRAYQRGAAADPESVGTRFMLSPRHPRVDICDMHARANLHGLGAGVYPHGRSPLPAHPNTLSFEVIVYRDEVTAADREGKQTVVEFLQQVPSKDRKGILGANKNEAFEAGDLPASQVESSWRDVKSRLDRQQKSET